MSENTNNEKENLDELLENVEDSVEEVVEIKKEVKENISFPKPVAAEKPEEDTIKAPEAKDEKPGLGYVADGVLGSTVVKEEKKPATSSKKKEKTDTVAIHSTRNVTWSGVGKVYRGYNIVSKDASEQWLKRDHIRLATPEEVAKEYNN